MASIRVVDLQSVPLMASTDGVSKASLIPVDGPGEHGAIRFLHLGSESELYLHEGHLLPEAKVESHVHRTDEIIVVMEGELHLGARVLRAGSSVYVPANTLYSFRAGATGLRFLNFRAVRDDSHVLKDEFLAERAAARALKDEG